MPSPRLAPQPLSAAQRLSLLNRHLPKHLPRWKGLEEVRRCARCGEHFSGERVLCYQGGVFTRHTGSRWTLYCPGTNCDGDPYDWLPPEMPFPVALPTRPSERGDPLDCHFGRLLFLKIRYRDGGQRHLLSGHFVRPQLCVQNGGASTPPRCAHTLQVAARCAALEGLGLAPDFAGVRTMGAKIVCSVGVVPEDRDALRVMVGLACEHSLLATAHLESRRLHLLRRSLNHPGAGAVLDGKVREAFGGYVLGLSGLPAGTTDGLAWIVSNDFLDLGSGEGKDNFAAPPNPTPGPNRNFPTL